MKPIFKIVALIPLIILSACWDKEADQQAKDDARVIADGMREMRDATDARGEDRLSDNQIKQMENTMANMMDESNRKKALCGVIIIEVQNLISEKNMPAQFYKMADQLEEQGRQLSLPEAAEYAAEKRAEARQMEIDYQNSVDEIVKGSLLDWLFQMGLKSLDMFGAPENNKGYQELHHECMQKPFESVENPYEKMGHH